jgi:acylphosphatase
MEKKSSLSRAHITAHGIVQGVGFRFFINRKASSAGLKGWVKNADGFVEAVLEGDKEKVEKCLEACKQGPPFSKIKKLDVNWEDPTGEFDRFEVK